MAESTGFQPRKMTIGQDEWWPVFSLEPDEIPWSGSHEISEELYNRYNNALAEWNAVQDILEKMADEDLGI